ncbi:MAG: AAA domain-containing protein [bacterium]|nr:AAA domain-containing protein [bacterium]
MPNPLQRLRDRLDDVLSGQDEAKTGLVLALVAREHAYLEGPPGCGKSLLASAFAHQSGTISAAVRFHRDSGPAELLGDSVLRRLSLGRGERIRSELLPGPLLRAELAVLDDLSRAPGEALAPLLRILAERRALDCELPLECAIATGIPDAQDVHADPLEPTQLDRFAVQVRMRGLVDAGRWQTAREVIERECRGNGSFNADPALDTRERTALQARAAALSLDLAVRSGLLEFVQRLRLQAGCEGATLLTDRAFGRAAVSILRAHALVRGADRVEIQDLRALRYMLARRIPESLLGVVDELIDEVIHEGDRQGDRQGAPAISRPGATPSDGAAGSAGFSAQDESATADTTLEGSAATVRKGGDDDAAEVEVLLRALSGHFERGAADTGDDPGGQPRGYRRMRRLDEILDADPVDAVLLLEARLPGQPRVYRRRRENAGGTLAVLRDVSASMEGRLSRWAGQVVWGMVRTCAKRGMRMGYIEFNHDAERFSAGGRFFHRRYHKLLGLAASRRAEGRTNYEAPLRSALADFSRIGGRNRHIVLLTDGVPILGDPEVRRERALARELGVRVHTVFLGLGECPRVLGEIAAETGGLRFTARPRPGGKLSVLEVPERVAV